MLGGGYGDRHRKATPTPTPTAETKNGKRIAAGDAI
jgi:hypothetical protein